MAEPARPDARYAAFLSYSHKDAAAGGRLHRRLEGFRLPRRLIGIETARGPVPERLWPVFRDREELPAATDLSETVREALAQSGALIVLCSPHSAASLWVAEEIEIFRRLHPDRPVLAAILDGDPPDCFPAALRAFGQDGTWHEPLATDLRRGQDGAQLGLLKLVAGITGVGLDALVQRDAARRVRRVMTVTVMALLAMLVMAALAVVALQARSEAERQRAEAEGLIEFMHTDLREQLRGAGRLDIMAAVNQRALDYFQGQDADSSAPDELAMRARITQTIGEVLLTRGDTGRALAKFRQAHAETSRLIQLYPEDPDVLYAHGQSEFWIGYVDQLRGNWGEAGRRYSNYAMVANRLIRIAPENPDYLLEKAWSASNWGVFQRDGARDPGAAQASFQTAVEWFERALRIRRRNRDALDLANAYADLADSFYVRGLWRQSLEARLRSLRINKSVLQADPESMDVVYRIAVAERSIGRLYDRLEQPHLGAPHLRSAYDRSRQLTVRDPSNAEWRLFQTKVECDLLRQVVASERAISDVQLRENIGATAAMLRRQGNPRVSEISICLRQL